MRIPYIYSYYNICMYNITYTRIYTYIILKWDSLVSNMTGYRLGNRSSTSGIGRNSVCVLGIVLRQKNKFSSVIYIIFYCVKCCRLNYMLYLLIKIQHYRWITWTYATVFNLNIMGSQRNEHYVGVELLGTNVHKRTSLQKKVCVQGSTKLFIVVSLRWHICKAEGWNN
jgi:hypothetical protein